MRAVESRIDIAAPPWRVWRLLTDFDTYSVWNPVLTRVRGRLEQGTRLRVRVEWPGRRSALTLKARVVALETGREVRWRSRLLLLPGLLDGEHAIRLEWLAQGRTTRLRHAVRFTGLLTPFAGFGDTLERAKRGLEAMDAALKAVAERSGARVIPADT